MSHKKRMTGLICGALLGGLLFSAAKAPAEGGYPPDYKPSQPAEKGETNVLARLSAVTTYMTDKLNTAGGQDSPRCYRDCLTIPFNEFLKCLETKSSYVASESCEQDTAQKMSSCNPKCQ